MFAWLVTSFLACTETQTPAPEAPAPEAAEAPPAPAVPEWKILAPSPLDLEKQVREAGVADTLSDLVPAKLPPPPPADDKDRVAFRTGVVFAYTLLTGRTAEKPATVANVEALRGGMAAIGTGAGLLGTMDKAIEALKNDSMSRDDFVQQLDAEVTSSVPSEGWAPNDTTGPMLQAGAWVAGTNVVAKAAVRKGDAAAAKALLHKPEVADFFLKYLSTEEGQDKAGSARLKVAETLAKLKELSGAEDLGIEQAKGIAEATDALLALL